VAANLYATRRDVCRWLPAGELTGSSRLAMAATASTDAITLDGHGLETGDPVTVRALEGATLPSPLVEGTVYYAIRLTGATFKLAASAGDSPIDIATNSSSVVVLKEPPFDDVIEFYSRWADALLPAHVAPLTEPIHPTVKGIVAELSAKKLLNLDGKASETLDRAEITAKAMLERFAKGTPLRGAAATAPSNLAVTTTMGAAADPRGWGSGSLP